MNTKDKKLDRDVFIKQLKENSEKSTKAFATFIEEGKLNNPNIKVPFSAITGKNYVGLNLSSLLSDANESKNSSYITETQANRRNLKNNNISDKSLIGFYSINKDAQGNKLKEPKIMQTKLLNTSNLEITKYSNLKTEPNEIKFNENVISKTLNNVAKNIGVEIIEKDTVYNSFYNEKQNTIYSKQLDDSANIDDKKNHYSELANAVTHCSLVKENQESTLYQKQVRLSLIQLAVTKNLGLPYTPSNQKDININQSISVSRKEIDKAYSDNLIKNPVELKTLSNLTGNITHKFTKEQKRNLEIEGNQDKKPDDYPASLNNLSLSEAKKENKLVALKKEDMLNNKDLIINSEFMVKHNMVNSIKRNHFSKNEIQAAEGFNAQIALNHNETAKGASRFNKQIISELDPDKTEQKKYEKENEQER